MAHDIKKLKKELLKKIDKDSQRELEKVDRYLNLVDIFYDLDNSIKESGTMVVTKNGAQEFLKPNPAISEKTKINTQLLALERSFEFGSPLPEGAAKDGSDLL